MCMKYGAKAKVQLNGMDQPDVDGMNNRNTFFSLSEYF